MKIQCDPRLGDRDIREESLQLLVIVDRQHDVSRSDPFSLVLDGGIPCQFDDLRDAIF